MGARLMERLRELQARHPAIGDVRGVGLFCGAEPVADRETRAPLPEKQVAATLARGVQLGMTNRSLPGLNDTLRLSPALIATADDIDLTADALDGALAEVC